MSFKRYGAKEIGRWIDGNIELAERLHALACASSDFRSAAPPRMSGVCLRYVAKGRDEKQLARLHARVVQCLEEIGRFWFSTTEMKGHSWFRINIVNFRTRAEHIDELFALLRNECERANEELGR
jgi:glutamate/tyrosine decarboxylase-like PLP-dependent enzyme